VSYIHDSLGADTAPPAPGSGYVWVAPAGGKAGYWRRAMAGETGTSGGGAVTQHVRLLPGLSETRKWDGSQWVVVETVSSQRRKECEAGLPPQYVDACVRLAERSGSTGNTYVAAWNKCGSLVPAEQAACFEQALATGRGGSGSAQRVATEMILVKRRRMLFLYGALGLAVLGAIYYFRKREQA
jgi:hypothetical protein